MARRRRSGDTGASLDSLLDTMTNVVGILVIILIVTQLGVQDAVKRITGMISEQELQAAQQEHEELEELLAEHEQEWDELHLDVPSNELALEKQQELIEQLKQDLAKLAEADVDPQQVEQDVEARRKKAEELEQQIAAANEEIARLKALLAETPPPGPDPEAKVVHLPNPRPAPKGAQPIELMCRDGRLVPIQTEELQAKAKELMNTASKAFDARPDPKDPKTLRVDGDALQELFERRVVGDRYFRVKIVVANGRPMLELHQKPNSGIETSRLASEGATFGRMLRSVDPREHFLRFRVFADSFETYLEARHHATRMDIPAGWIAYDENATYRIPLGTKNKVLVAGYTPPPPKPPSKDPQPDRPPPPGGDVD